MPISLTRATGAIQALRKLGGSQLFTMMTETNGYLFKKHVDKASAFEAAKTDHAVKGYFKKLSTVQVTSLAVYKGLSDRQVDHMVGGPTVKKPQAKHFGVNKPCSSTTSVKIAAGDFAELLAAAIRAPGQYLVNADHPNERFLYIVGTPSPYIGRSIDEHENKVTAGLDYAALIVVAPTQGNSLVMNMYPCSQGYFANKTALV